MLIPYILKRVSNLPWLLCSVPKISWNRALFFLQTHKTLNIYYQLFSYVVVPGEVKFSHCASRNPKYRAASQIALLSSNADLNTSDESEGDPASPMWHLLVALYYLKNVAMSRWGAEFYLSPAHCTDSCLSASLITSTCEIWSSLLSHTFDMFPGLDLP